ncbi:hypothetical protein PENTCL1PPCAC_30746, partial [Pristionchus entomophagus]
QVTVTMPAIRSFPDARPCSILVSEGDHKRELYSPVFPHSLSLDSCEGDAKAATIEFAHDTAMHVAGLEKLQSSGDFLQTPPIPLYHAHVLWAYTLRITRVKDQKCSLTLVSIGPHLGLDNSEKKGSLGRNAPSGMCMPRVLGASIAILGGGEEKEEGERMDLSPDRGGSLAAKKQFNPEKLQALAGGGDSLGFRVRILIGRSYFALSKLVDLKDRSTTVSGQAEGILGLIVRGERPPGYDCAITVSESDVPGPTLFYVHKVAFGSMSDAFKVAFQTGHSYEDQILMVTGEPRCIVTALTTEDMKVVIPLVYGLFAPLPERWQRVSVLGRTLCRLFKPDLIKSVLFPQWERAICQQALALDKADDASFSAIFRLLTIIWSCPYAAMPVAKRVAIGVMADMVSRGVLNQWISLEVIPSLGDLGKTVHVEPIYNSMANHLAMVSSVRKTGLATKHLEWN